MAAQRFAPGDTVFIAYSGHTGQVEDREGDEPDKLDEYLVPTDFVNLGVLAGMEKRAQVGGLREATGPISKIAAMVGGGPRHG